MTRTRATIVAVLWLVASVAIVAGAERAQAQDAGAIRTVPTSVASDCSRDVGDELKFFLGGLPPGSTGALKPGACYLVDQRLSLAGKADVTLDGNLATLRKANPAAECGTHRGHLQIGNATNITIRELRLEGTSPNYTTCHAFEHAIEAQAGTVGLNVIDVTARAIPGDCIYIAGAKRVDVERYRCESNGRQGAGIVDGTELAFNRFDVLDSDRSGIDFEANRDTAVIADVTVTNSTFAVNNLAIASQGRNATIDRFTYNDNVVTKAKGWIWGHQTPPSGPTQDECRNRHKRHAWHFARNTVSGVGAFGGARVVLCGIADVELIGNKLASGGDVPILLENAAAPITIRDNDLAPASDVYKAEAQTAPVTACNNRLAAAGAFDKPRPCGGTPPPSSTTTTTTSRPPTSSTSTTTTTTTRPPVTTAPRDPEAVLRQILELLEAYFR